MLEAFINGATFALGVAAVALLVGLVLRLGKSGDKDEVKELLEEANSHREEIGHQLARIAATAAGTKPAEPPAPVEEPSDWQLKLKRIPRSELADYLAKNSKVREDVVGALSYWHKIDLVDVNPLGDNAYSAFGKNGAAMILAERNRQVIACGYSPGSDDHYILGELWRSAAAYLHRDVAFWPWRTSYFKLDDDDRIRELTKAGGLIAAEIDRLLRLRAKENGNG